MTRGINFTTAFITFSSRVLFLVNDISVFYEPARAAPKIFITIIIRLAFWPIHTHTRGVGPTSFSTIRRIVTNVALRFSPQHDSFAYDSR